MQIAYTGRVGKCAASARKTRISPLPGFMQNNGASFPCGCRGAIGSYTGGSDTSLSMEKRWFPR